MRHGDLKSGFTQGSGLRAYLHGLKFFSGVRKMDRPLNRILYTGTQRSCRVCRLNPKTPRPSSLNSENLSEP